MLLKILIKQATQYNIQLVAGHYAGTNPQNLNFTAGALPANRQWQSYGQFIDVTEEVTGLNKLKLTWTAERDEEGNVTAGDIFTTRSASGELIFYGDTFQLLKQWLIDDVSAPLNSVDVKIQHIENGVVCGTYEDYAIKAADLQYCDTINLCQFTITLKQKDQIRNCIKNTLIADNWQGWFQETPTNGKRHPRFSYCNEQRPNGMLTALWYNMYIISSLLFVIGSVIIVVINVIIAVLIAVISVINAIINFINNLGANINTINTPTFIGFGSLVTEIQQMFVESAGCGREHPAPLIRDYISNVCGKCGVTVNEDTAPIFFAQQLTIQTSDTTRGNGGVITATNPHYNACYLFPQTQRGVRRFDTINPFNTSMNMSTWYLPKNAPLHTLDTFLDELKGLYNAEWRLSSKLINGVYVPHLYFQRRDFYQSNQYIYDFSAKGKDRVKMVYGVCSEFNDKKYPAALKGLYQGDSAEVCGNEAKAQMDGYVTFGNTNFNPNYEGLKDKEQRFGATRFRFDAAGNDYIFDAMQVNINGGLLTNLIVPLMIDIVLPAFTRYADYVLLMKHDLVSIPKVLIWDGERFENARALKPKVAISAAGNPEPEINPYYNNYPSSQAWAKRFPPDTFVIGSALTPGNSPIGYYTLQNYFGIKSTERQAFLVNYPMYFAEGFRDSMWDWFHWIDDPNKRPVMNQTHTMKIRLCCDDLKHLGLFGALNNVKLAQKVKIPSQFYPDAKITEITVDYNDEDTFGKNIEIKCRV